MLWVAWLVIMADNKIGDLTAREKEVIAELQNRCRRV
jgi:hypothetical protein